MYSNVKQTLEYLFPELAESDDEMIRKELIEYFEWNAQLLNNFDNKDVIAWLEKQGQTYTKKDVDDAWLQGICDAKRELVKQGEQKPHDNSAPKANKEEQVSFFKFHKGDWIVSNDGKDVFFIKDVSCGYCSLEDTNGNVYSNCQPLDSDFHLWTIEDAKDGDVLCYKNEISLYNYKIKNYKGVETTFCGFVYYCCYDGEEFITDSFYSLTEANKCDIHPATKEQRDLLFQKIKEAGYEWNDNEKVLVGFDNDDEQHEELEDDETDLNIKQNLSWSEEDEEMLGKCIDAASGYYSPEDKQSMKDWLKSLKDRVQPQQKQEWSEEDEKYINDILAILGGGRGYRSNRQIEEWLKSLKPQPHWKPTEEQMEDLKYAINMVDKCCEDSLQSLYNELKKL